MDADKITDATGGSKVAACRLIDCCASSCAAACEISRCTASRSFFCNSNVSPQCCCQVCIDCAIICSLQLDCSTCYSNCKVAASCINLQIGDVTVDLSGVTAGWTAGATTTADAIQDIQVTVLSLPTLNV